MLSSILAQKRAIFAGKNMKGAIDCPLAAQIANFGQKAPMCLYPAIINFGTKKAIFAGKI
jgi:hypothetical protein